jgi:hydrogenase expression/formation protein HypC
VLSEDEAHQTSAALDALDAAFRGESDVDAFFADLVDLEPTLPAHLRKQP